MGALPTQSARSGVAQRFGNHRKFPEAECPGEFGNSPILFGGGVKKRNIAKGDPNHFPTNPTSEPPKSGDSSERLCWFHLQIL